MRMHIGFDFWLFHILTSKTKHFSLFTFSLRASALVVIKNTKYSTTFFNCRPWSDYVYEDERLFCGGFCALTIVGLSHIPTSKDFGNYIKSMQIFQNCVEGFVLYSKLSSKYSNIGRKLYK